MDFFQRRTIPKDQFADWFPTLREEDLCQILTFPEQL